MRKKLAASVGMMCALYIASWVIIAIGPSMSGYWAHVMNGLWLVAVVYCVAFMVAGGVYLVRFVAKKS